MGRLELKIGDFVKLTKKGPFPKLMGGSFQKIVDLRTRDGRVEIRIQRQRRHRQVECWIEAQFAERLATPEEFKPSDSCERFSPRTAGSAEDMIRRGWCRICGIRNHCEPYKNRFSREETA